MYMVSVGVGVDLAGDSSNDVVLHGHTGEGELIIALGWGFRVLSIVVVGF